MSRISRTRGKNTELAIAKELGAKRNHFEVEDLVVMRLGDLKDIVGD